MDKRLLENRTINTADYPELPKSWYAPTQYFNRFKSIRDVNHFDTTSSAGDWSGYIEQKIGKTSYLILFDQSNNWPQAGYTVNTGEVIASWQGDMTREEVYQIIEDHNRY
jgi:hypothetical protein